MRALALRRRRAAPRAVVQRARRHRVVAGAGRPARCAPGRPPRCSTASWWPPTATAARASGCSSSACTSPRPSRWPPAPPRCRWPTWCSTCSTSTATTSATCRWPIVGGSLDQVLEPGPRWRVSPLHDDGPALLDAAKERGLEGVVAKRLDSRYEPGKRTRTLAEGEGAAPPGDGGGRLAARRGQPHRAASARCSSATTTRPATAGRCGSPDGSAPASRTPSSPGSAGCSTSWPPTSAPSTRRRPAPRSCAGPRWVRPELVAELEFGEWTHDDRLRHPSYLGPARRQARRGGDAAMPDDVEHPPHRAARRRPGRRSSWRSPRSRAAGRARSALPEARRSTGIDVLERTAAGRRARRATAATDEPIVLVLHPDRGHLRIEVGDETGRADGRQRPVEPKPPPRLSPSSASTTDHSHLRHRLHHELRDALAAPHRVRLGRDRGSRAAP